MRFVAIGVVLVVASCTSPSRPTATLSSPASTSRSQSPGPLASPTQFALPSVVPVAFSCKLPITWDVNPGQGYVRKAGFLKLPELAITEAFTAPAPTADQSTGSWFYDRAFSRWVPTFREAVSNDGRRYAYTTGNAFLNAGGTVHVVDIATGTDTTLYSGNTDYSVVAFAAEGIYLTLQAPEGRPRGLWLQDPTGGPARLINRTVVAPWVAGGVGWGIDFDTTDPSPAPGGIESPFNRLVWIDLQSGATTPWFTWLGTDIFPDGVDYSGNPFVGVGRPSPSDPSTQTEELWFVRSKGAVQRLFSGRIDQPWPMRLGAIENHGTWFNGGSAQTSPSTIWLYAGGGLRIVASVNLESVTIAGGCIDT